MSCQAARPTLRWPLQQPLANSEAIQRAQVPVLGGGGFELWFQQDYTPPPVQDREDSEDEGPQPKHPRQLWAELPQKKKRRYIEMHQRGGRC